LVSLKTGAQLTALALGALAVFLIVRGGGKFLENLKFPTVPNPFENFEFPKFPEVPNPFDEGFFSDLQKQFDNFFNNNTSSIAGQTVPSEPGSDVPVTIPEDTMVNEDGTVTSSTPPTIDLGVGSGLNPLGEIAFNQLRSRTITSLTNQGFSPAKVFAAFRNINFKDSDKPFKALDKILQTFNTPLSPVQRAQQISQQGGKIPFDLPELKDQPIQNFLNQGGQTFLGGGTGFIGGSVTETPIANLSLSQIIDKFGVTASQARNLLDIAKDNFGDFNFGTNTGTGIGSIFQNPNFSNILPQNTTNVSNPSFQGLSPTQIALQLTGGNIQNFA